MIAALLLGLGLGLGLGLAPAPQSSAPEAAEAAYREGRLEEARVLFEAAAAEPGVSAGAALYNAGNAALRLGRPAEAVLLYRRAALRLPADPEVEHNLYLARYELGLAEPPVPGALAALAARLDRVDPWLRLAIASAAMTAGLAGFVLARGRRASRAGWALLVLVGLLLGARLVHARLEPPGPEAVVLAAEIALRPIPDHGEPITLLLGAGEGVLVRERSCLGHWLRVDHPRGRGWTEAEGLGLVD